MENVYDIGIVGGGPAGYTTALRFASQNKRVILFEKDAVGGVCLNRGCIPTKTILHSSEIYKQALNSEQLGITVLGVSLDYKKVLERKNKVVLTLRKGIELALKNAKVTVINSNAQILSKTEIEAEGVTYNCEQIICAAGSVPKSIKGLEFDHKFILSSDDILELGELPDNILIVGSGAIGTEWARIFSNFGVEVTVLEVAQNILPLADTEVSKRLERIFKTNKIKFYTQTTITKISGNKVTLSNNEELKPDLILVAAGRSVNNSDKIDGVKYIGDVCGEIQLAHYAIKQAVELSDGITFRKDLVPSVVYGTPEVAWVGKREQDLEGEGYLKSMTLISSLGKAHCDNQTDGFIKLLSQNGQIVGAHIVSNEASALIQQVVIAMQNNISVEKFKEICFAHPTYSEGIFESLIKLK